MYPNYNMYQTPRNMRFGRRNQIQTYSQDSRAGGFVVPFLLGGLAGGALVGSRPNNNNFPNYYPTYPNYYPYPYYNNTNYFYPPYYYY